MDAGKVKIVTKQKKRLPHQKPPAGVYNFQHLTSYSTGIPSVNKRKCIFAPWNCGFWQANRSFFPKLCTKRHDCRKPLAEASKSTYL